MCALVAGATLFVFAISACTANTCVAVFGMRCSVWKCYSALHRAALHYYLLQRVAACCSVLQYDASDCCNRLANMIEFSTESNTVLQRVAARCSVLQCVSACCTVLQCVVASCNVLQYVAVCCSVLQCVVASCSVLWLRFVGSLKV